MTTLKEAVADFLAQRTFAVAGVSRNPDQAANAIYRKLRDAGYHVYPVNPRADHVQGERCFPDLKSLPEKVDGVVVATPPSAAPAIVEQCRELGIGRVWLHRSFGQGSVSEEAVRLGREHGLTVIAGGCPMMFCEPVDFGHRCIRWIAGIAGSLPKEV